MVQYIYIVQKSLGSVDGLVTCVRQAISPLLIQW